MIEFITNNFLPLTIAALAFIKVVVNLTPSESDNKVFSYFDILITAITGDRRKNKKK